VNEFIEKKIKRYEIAKLPEKHPEYKYLLEEYHDGILLFNLTEDKVWRKAVEDSAGLLAFYNQLPEKYQWEERIVMSKFAYEDSTLTPQLIKLAKKRVKKGWDEKTLSMMLCGQDTLPCISITELKYERGDNALADELQWKKGTYRVSKDKDNTILYFMEGTLPPQLKKLEDARGLYTADYQSHLEKLWIEELRAKYTIKVNEEVLDKLREMESGT